MEVLLLDIAETLEARDVRLPGGKTVISMVEHNTDDVVEISDEEYWNEEEEIPQLQEIHRASGSVESKSIGSTGDPKIGKRLSAVKREQRYGHRDEGTALAADVDKMHI